MKDQPSAATPPIFRAQIKSTLLARNSPPPEVLVDVRGRGNEALKW
jgi:hypothetical protein